MLMKRANQKCLYALHYFTFLWQNETFLEYSQICISMCNYESYCELFVLFTVIFCNFDNSCSVTTVHSVTGCIFLCFYICL